VDRLGDVSRVNDTPPVWERSYRSPAARRDALAAYGKAVFDCASQNIWREYELPATLGSTQLYVDRHFHLKPLAHLLGASPLLGILLVDRHRARAAEGDAGRADPAALEEPVRERADAPPGGAAVRRELDAVAIVAIQDVGHLGVVRGGREVVGPRRAAAGGRATPIVPRGVRRAGDDAVPAVERAGFDLSDPGTRKWVEAGGAPLKGRDLCPNRMQPRSQIFCQGSAFTTARRSTTRFCRMA